MDTALVQLLSDILPRLNRYQEALSPIMRTVVKEKDTSSAVLYETMAGSISTVKNQDPQWPLMALHIVRSCAFSSLEPPSWSNARDRTVHVHNQYCGFSLLIKPLLPRSKPFHPLWSHCSLPTSPFIIAPQRLHFMYLLTSFVPPSSLHPPQ